MSPETPETPTIASAAELHEGTEAYFNCSTPYACPEEHISLQWQGQDPSRSVTSSFQNLKPTGISHLGTLHMALSWQDHGRTLQCELSVAKQKTQGKIHLQVQCECAGGHTLGTKHTSVASPVETSLFSSPRLDPEKKSGTVGPPGSGRERDTAKP